MSTELRATPAVEIDVLSYDAERAPVARQIVQRANQSTADTGRIIAALDVDDTTDVGRLEQQLALRRAPGATWAQLRETADAGVLVVRPDLHVAARNASAPGSQESGVDAHTWMYNALSQALGRQSPDREPVMSAGGQG